MKELTLGDSVEQLIDHRGKTPRKLGTEFVNSGVPVASAGIVRNGRLQLEEARHVDGPTFVKWMPTHLRAGDVILTSEAPLGCVARVPNDQPLVLGQRLFGLRGRDRILDSGYLYYALQTERVQADLLGHSTGTTVFGIRQSALRKIKIPAPNFLEQRAIAEVLGALDDKIAANNTIVRISDNLAEAIVFANLDGTYRELASLADITMGSSPPGTSYNETGNGVPFYQGTRDFGTRFPGRRVSTTLPVRVAKPGDTLVSVRAPVGETNLANEELCVGRGLAAVHSRANRPMTLFHQVRAASDAWAPYQAEGTVFGSINKKQLEAVPVPCVPNECAAQLESQLQAIEDRIAAALVENQRLAATRDELLPLLMSGKVRVRDAEKAVEEVV